MEVWTKAIGHIFVTLLFILVIAYVHVNNKYTFKFKHISILIKKK